MRFSLLFLCLFLIHAPLAADESKRRFEFSYEIRTDDLPTEGELDLYIPLPVQNNDQHILQSRISSSTGGVEKLESSHGNRFFHIKHPSNAKTPLAVTLSWIIERKVVTANALTLTEEERVQYLAPNKLVPVDHEILAPIQAEIHSMRSDDSDAATARAIYDWVVDNVEYKKVGTGWGNGDTFWACNERNGNCTDFHALFIALARSEGIPARFEIGFPIPADRSEGEIGGYHCWVQFYLPEKGWIPIDASEAAKHPEKRELFYGTHPADRIHFSTGRDLVLSKATEADPLNYFIFPHIEINSLPSNAKVETKFSYRELTDKSE